MVKIPRRATFIELDSANNLGGNLQDVLSRATLNPQAGYEQMGVRPALVVSHTAFNRKLGFAFVCPLSTTTRQNRFYVPIPYGLTVNGVIMCDQLRSLDYIARISRHICDCPEPLFTEVLARIKPIMF